MIAALLAGLVFATSHHIFYSNLAGKSSADEDMNILGASLSKQQVNIAVGTALAFLVKAFLVIAVSTAYIQTLWSAAKAHRSSGPITVIHLDAAFAVLDNFLAFARLPLWLRNPLMLGLAGTAWFVLQHS